MARLAGTPSRVLATVISIDKGIGDARFGAAWSRPICCTRRFLFDPEGTMKSVSEIILAATVFAILAVHTAMGDDKTTQTNPAPEPATTYRIFVWYAGEPDPSDTCLHDAAAAIRRQGLIYFPRDIKQSAQQPRFEKDMDLPALRKPLIEEGKKMFIQRGYVLPNGSIGCGVPWELTPTVMTVDEQVTLFIGRTAEPQGGRQALLERMLAGEAFAKAKSASIATKRSEPATTYTAQSPSRSTVKAKSASIAAKRSEPTATRTPQSALPPTKAMLKVQARQKVNINSAAKEKLEALPGIGPVKAQGIIDARPFKTVEEVMKVRGVKEGEFAKIKDVITVK
jgi:competence ComEA-like helix-hairpin-helix protein